MVEKTETVTRTIRWQIGVNEIEKVLRDIYNVPEDAYFKFTVSVTDWNDPEFSGAQAVWQEDLK